MRGTAWAAILILVPGVFGSCGPARDGNERPNGIPESAIRVNDALYMVPLGVDEDGCQMYQAHAPGKVVAQVIHYRAADGSFVMDKQEAVCSSDQG